jgi:poly(A)-specific ribonuclease
MEPDPELKAMKMLMDFVHRLDKFPTFEHTKPIPSSFPGFGSDFWNVFSNILKVNGTIEGVWLLE